MDQLDRERLMDMLEYSRAAIRMLGPLDAAALQDDEKSFFAVCHAVQTVGEAASKVSPAAKALLPGIQWPKVIGMRHRLVHGYRASSTKIIAQTVVEDLPVLVPVLERALQDASR